MSRFDDVVKIVFDHEGGLVDDPDDSGGRTNYGVTQDTLNAARKIIPGLPEKVDDLTPGNARVIFRVMYWDRIKCGEMPPPLDFLAFDTAINCGVGGAGLQVQRAVNRMGGRLKEDGAIGPLTLGAVNAAFDSDPWRTIHAVVLERVRWHNNIVNRKKSQIKFLNGWLNRILKNADIVGI